jgi:hypothetical protein
MNLTARILAPVAVSFLATFAAACGGAPAASTEDESASTSEAISANEEAAYKFFVAKGLKSYQAAGIVGNLIQESSVSPTISQYGGGPGRGIAQWSEGGRWNASHDDNVAWYAAREGQSMYSLDLQLEFVWYELTTFSGYGLAELRSSPTIDDATIAFETRFEGCGECDPSNRIQYAQEVLDEYGKETTTTAPAAATPVPKAPSGCGSVKPGEGLKAGESFTSCSGEFSLDMQTDGNLVLYRSESKGQVSRWSSGTAGTDGYVAIMQGDGNFVVYGRHSNPLWSSVTEGHANVSEVAVQDDGNLVIYVGSRPLWASNTAENEIGR